jgi:hypothetical protein
VAKEKGPDFDTRDAVCDDFGQLDFHLLLVGVRYDGMEAVITKCLAARKLVIIVDYFDE